MTVVAMLARRRVALGFICGIVVLVLARPTSTSLQVGGFIAVIGELIRIWAAGHLEKDREVTTSGPYRFTRHPLYLGSGIMALGVVIAARHPTVTLLLVVCFAVTYASAIWDEETRLTDRFGPAYPDYKAGRQGAVARTFSLQRAIRNREYRAVAGLFTVLALLSLRLFVR
jgi:protein-S-isoprenylcysteine O-methyltransferase Ste14